MTRDGKTYPDNWRRHQRVRDFTINAFSYFVMVSIIGSTKVILNNSFRSMFTFRCNDYSYEQFVNPNWEQFLELETRSGGPANRKPTVPDKPKLIT
jgi:hypothetical protein